MIEITQTVQAWRVDDPPLRLGLQPSPASLDEASQKLPPGVYTTLRTYSGGQRVVGLNQHLRRLEQSAQAKGWRQPLDEARLRSVMRVAIRAQQIMLIEAGLPAMESRLRLTWDLEQHPGDLFVTIQPLPAPQAKIYNEGVCVQSSPLQRSDPLVKDTQFLTQTQHLRHNLPEGIYELLLSNADGGVLEGMTSNFYVIQRGSLYTAGEGVLEGITRMVTLELARRLDMPVHFTPPLLGQLAAWEEAFLTSSSRGIVPVVRVDGILVKGGLPGPKTKQLSAAYRAYTLYEADLI